MLSSDSLADKIAPRLRAILESREEQIVANAGNILNRSAVRMAFPILLQEVSNITHSAIDLISEEFGKLNVNDLIEFLDHQATERMRGLDTRSIDIPPRR